MFPVQHYFLEDCIQLCNFYPPPDQRKRKSRESGGNDDDDEKHCGAEEGEDLNKEPLGSEYTDQTKRSMSAISEKDVCLNLFVRIFFSNSQLIFDFFYRLVLN